MTNKILEVKLTYHTYEIPNTEYNKGVIEILKHISEEEGWENREEYYFEVFFKGKYKLIK